MSEREARSGRRGSKKAAKERDAVCGERQTNKRTIARTKTAPVDLVSFFRYERGAEWFRKWKCFSEMYFFSTFSLLELSNACEGNDMSDIMVMRFFKKCGKPRERRKEDKM